MTNMMCSMSALAAAKAAQRGPLDVTVQGSVHAKAPSEFREDRVDLPKHKCEIYLAAEGEMSKEPKIEHDYHAGKDKLTITIHRYSLKSKKTRDAILEKLRANLESKPDRLIADAKEKSKKGPGKKLRGQQKASKLIVTGD